MANELAVIKKYDVVPVDSDIMEAFREEMEGLGNMPIDTIKIPSGGGIAFEVPGDLLRRMRDKLPFPAAQYHPLVIGEPRR